MSKAWITIIASVALSIAGYVGSYIAIRETRGPILLHPWPVAYYVDIGDTVCAFEDSTFIGRWDSSPERSNNLRCDSSADTDGFYLSYFYEPLWRLEAWMQISQER